MRGDGDQVWRETWDGRAERLRELASRIDARRDSTDLAHRRSRHAEVVRLLIESGELAQAVIDAEFESGGQRDGFTPLHAAALELVRTAADAVIESLRHGDRTTPLRAIGAQIRAQLARVHQVGAPDELIIRNTGSISCESEVPDLYAEAAERLPRNRRRAVIGARTIGVTLGAIVSAALDAETFVTVRPTNERFRRGLSLDDTMREAVLAEADEYAIVDGPRCSGTAFEAIAGYLEQNGIERGRIVFFTADPGIHLAQPGSGLELLRTATRR